jgi:hypothetical protein
VDHSITTVIVGAILTVDAVTRNAIQDVRAARAAEIKAMDTFGISGARLFATTLPMFFLAASVGGAIAGVVHAAAGPEAAGAVTLFVVLSLVFPACYLVGRWAGRRSKPGSIFVVFAAAMAARLLDVGVLAALDPTQLRQMSGLADVAWWSLGLSILGGAMAFSLVGLIGYWRGTRQRRLHYLQYLLASVSKDDRDALVSLAQEVASRVAASHGSALPSVSAFAPATR